MDFIVKLLIGKFQDLGNFFCHLYYFGPTSKAFDCFLNRISKQKTSEVVMQQNFEGVKDYFEIH